MVKERAKYNKQQEDFKLIVKIRQGDQEALSKLLDRYLPQLMGFFRYLKVPDAMIEDMVQATFEKLLKKLNLYDDSKSFSSWIMTIGRNLYFDEHRRESCKREHVQEMPVISPVTPEEEVIVRHSASELLKALTSQEKFIVEMRIFQGVPFAEIAEMTGEVEATLRSRFFRLMKRLRISTVKSQETLKS